MAPSDPLAEANEREGQSEQHERQTDVEGVHHGVPFIRAVRALRTRNVERVELMGGLGLRSIALRTHVARHQEELTVPPVRVRKEQRPYSDADVLASCKPPGDCVLQEERHEHAPERGQRCLSPERFVPGDGKNHASETAEPEDEQEWREISIRATKVETRPRRFGPHCGRSVGRHGDAPWRAAGHEGVRTERMGITKE